MIFLYCCVYHSFEISRIDELGHMNTWLLRQLQLFCSFMFSCMILMFSLSCKKYIATVGSQVHPIDG